MYYRVCPDCGATLDPDEKCNCRAEIEHYIQKAAELTETEKDGQLRLKVS